MQILAIPQTEITRSNLLWQMYRLRSRVFKDRLGWQVAPGKLELDEFDALKPTYLLALNSADRVVGCVRLLPAIGPTMLETQFPELLERGALFGHPQMVETSRFCVDTSLKHERSGTSQLHHATLCLLAGIVEWCLTEGYEEVVTATDLGLERILKRAKWPLHRLGEPRMIDRTKSVAGRLIVDLDTFERLRPKNYSSLFPTTAPAA